MIVRPTVAQLLRDCRREIDDTLVPELATETARVAAEQLDIILEQCAVRAEHEVAWMLEEIEAMGDYATVVAERLDDDSTKAALAATIDGRSGSLHVEELGHDYNRMSEALSCALEAAVVSGDAGLKEQGLELLIRYRKDRERELMANWRLVGRG